MDPNANLDEQLKLAQSIVFRLDDPDEQDYDVGDVVQDAERLAELVISLNQWIAGGGFLPRRWAQS
jgi:hypothetical protein